MAAIPTRQLPLGPRRAIAGEPGIPRFPTTDPFRDPISIAVVDLIAERGYEDVNEHDIIRRAGVSTDEFRRRFADKQDCTIATVKATMDVFRWTLEVAYSSGCDWQSGLRASAWAAADYLDAHPTIVQVVAVDLLAARNEMLRVVREDALMFSAFLIERGRATAPDPEVVPAGARSEEH